MTQIFLIRHGEAEGNLYRRAQGQTDSPLTAKGREQAASLAPRFAEVPLDAAYASDLCRARDTALAAVGGRDVPVVIEPRLREMGFGAWENRPWGEINREDMDLKTWFLTDPEKWHVPGSEDFAVMQGRIYAAMENIARRHEGGAVLVVCHGVAIRAFLARVRGVASADILSVRLPDNASVTALRWEDGAFSIEYVNDTSHLPEPPYVPFRETNLDKAGVSYDLRYTPFDTKTGKELYLRCYRDAWRTAHGSLRGFDENACWRGAVLRAADSPAALTAAWRDEDFAGILALDERRGAGRGIGWIAFLYIVPELRRHRCGIQLIGTAAARYRALGRRCLRLTVAPSNPALGFYRWAGFAEADTEPGALEPLLVMEKPL